MTMMTMMVMVVSCTVQRTCRRERFFQVRDRATVALTLLGDSEDGEGEADVAALVGDGVEETKGGAGEGPAIETKSTT